MADPTAQPGFWGRWRASDLTGADGSAVASWASSNGFALAHGTAAKRPVLGTDANGRRYVSFDGVDDSLEGATPSLLNAKGGATVYLVANKIAAGEYQVLISQGAANTARLIVASITGSNRGGGRRLDADGFQTHTGAATITGAPAVQVTRIDYANRVSQVFQNGTLGGELLTFQTAGVTSATNPQVMAMGSGVGSLYTQMRAYELLVFEAAHTAAERAQVHSYIQDTYGVTVADYVAPPPPPPPANYDDLGGLPRTTAGYLALSTTAVASQRGFPRTAGNALAVATSGTAAPVQGFARTSTGALRVVVDGTGTVQRGFLRDAAGSLIVTGTGPFTMQNGFLRDAAGRLAATIT